MSDDMHCATCGLDIYDQAIPSVQLIEWVPSTRSNVLLASFCQNATCLRDWVLGHGR